MNIELTGASDARFDVIAPSDPLLSVSLSPSQSLYTRKGTLVGVSGKAENVRVLSLMIKQEVGR